MKKFFMKETDDELHFGDTIEVDLIKDETNKAIHKHLECVFMPELVNLLVEKGIIEEREAAEEEAKDANTLDFDDENDAIGYLLEQVEQLKLEKENLENRLIEVEGIVSSLPCVNDSGE